MELNFIKKPKQGILTLFAIIVIMLFLPLGTSTWVSLTRTDLEHEQKQAILIKEQTAELLSTLTDMETGQRGYVITGKLDFLQPYKAGVEHLDKLMPNLRSNLKSNPAISPDIDELDYWVEFKHAELQKTIEMRNAEGLKVTRDYISKGVGKEYMDHIRSIVADVLEKQNMRTTLLAKQLKWKTTLGAIVGLSTIIVCIGLLTILTMCIFRLVDLQKNLYDERTKLIQEISKIAFHDSLTGLANRLKFHEETLKMQVDAERDDTTIALFLIDLDNFKTINDSHGHRAGDEVLKTVAKRLDIFVKAYCKSAKELGKYTDACNCLAARLGGDEFVIAIEGMTKEEVNDMGNHLIEELRKTVELNDIETSLSSSVGVSMYPTSGKNIGELMSAADMAMYAAKDKGKDQFCFHDLTMNTKIERRIEAENLVRDIIAEEKVQLYFQPIIDVETEKVVSCEALLRSVNSGFSPTEIVAAAEDSRLIIPLGIIIMRHACQFGQTCIERGLNLDMAVNVSAPQLIDPLFKHMIQMILEQTKFPPSKLIIEITETLLISNFETSSKVLSDLREMGIRISIDDFGKGYSSFNYLHNLPISKLKIDMSFVQQLGKDDKSNEIVKAIILMSDALGLMSCAEGVETQEQFDILKELGCTRVQGWLKYPALDEGKFLELMSVNNP